MPIHHVSGYTCSVVFNNFIVNIIKTNYLLLHIITQICLLHWRINLSITPVHKFIYYASTFVHRKEQIGQTTWYWSEVNYLLRM